jgi:predicted MFS family arabinose efflux permease
MVKAMSGWARGKERDFLLFLISGVFLGITISVDGSTLTNYLKEHIGMVILQRSALEFPRELPGLLVVVVIGLLSFLGDVRIGMIANLVAGIGMFSLGIIPPSYALVILTIFIYSMGLHMFMPVGASIAMSFAKPEEVGKVMGRLAAVTNIAVVVSSAALWALFRFLHMSFAASFAIGAAAYLISAILLAFIKPTRTVRVKKRYVFRKEYRLYYWLCMLYGARKQIFITFGPWVLVDVFKQHVSTMAILFFVIAVAGIFLKPWIGHLIDKVGERFVLSWEAFLFFFACLGYAFAEDVFPGRVAIFFIYACYVLDFSLDSVYMARTTYMGKIALRPEDVSPSLSLGTSLDHLVTIFLPLLGGIVWTTSGPGGYKYVFMGGALIAVVNFVSSRMIRTNVEPKPATAAAD